jgi:hypothetical protein
MEPIAGDTTAVWISDGGNTVAYNDVLLLLGGATLIYSAPGDTLACWLDAELQAAIRGGVLEEYSRITALSPPPEAREVRRDWGLYAEITDSLGGIETGTVTCKIDGQTVAATVTAITDGYRVEYTPPALAAYREQIRVVLAAVDADGYMISRAWSFSTEAAPAATVTDAPPPNVVCIRDIGLTAAEADETIEAVPVTWLEDLTSPLYITEAQAREVGRVAIDERTYHRHVRSVAVLASDAAGLPLAGLQQGSIITLTCPAIGMAAKKCEILAAQRQAERAGEEDMTYTLTIAYYEAV